MIEDLQLNKQRGFTMVELLMTITLVGILSGVATVQFIDYRKEAKTAVTNKKMSEIVEALVGNPSIVANGQYVKSGIIVDVGEVPATLESLATIGSYDAYDLYEKKGWRGPYVNTNSGAGQTWSQDAWGTNFSYSQGTRILTSCGPDLICGDGNAADDIALPF